MGKIYDCYSDFIEYKNGDKAYVYHGCIFNKKNKIDENFIGTIISIEQSKYEDWLGTEYLKYRVVIELDSGEKVTIDSENSFRKYDFITLADLANICRLEKILDYNDLFITR